MKKFFEEPEFECIRVTSEAVTTDTEIQVPGGDLGLSDNIFPDIK